MTRIVYFILLVFCLCGCRSQRHAVEDYTEMQQVDSIHYHAITTGMQSLRGEELTERDVEVYIDILGAPDSTGVQPIVSSKVVRMKDKAKRSAVSTMADTIATQAAATNEVATVARTETRHPPNDGGGDSWPSALKWVGVGFMLFIIYKVYENYRGPNRSDMG